MASSAVAITFSSDMAAGYGSDGEDYLSLVFSGQRRKG